MNNSLDSVVAQVNQHIPHVRLPDVGTWSNLEEGGRSVYELELQREALSENLQTNTCSAPFFLLCFGYWAARFSGSDPLLRLRIQGSAPSDEKLSHHDTRARIALEALQVGLGERLQVQGLEPLEWPKNLVMNAPRRKGAYRGGRGEEHHLETQICQERHWAQTAPELCGPLGRLERQLPLGLYTGRVSATNTWTPRGGAQADLWATSPGGESFHLFELQTGKNAHLGALPQLLTHLWILNKAQGGAIAGGGPGAQAVRRAQRLQGWWLAPRLHPLLMQGQDSPIRWLSAGLKPHLDLGYLSFEETEAGEFGAWRPEQSLRFSVPE